MEKKYFNYTLDFSSICLQKYMDSNLCKTLNSGCDTAGLWYQ